MSRRLTLRVSVLDRCQYRCAYCLPGSVSPFLQASRWLSVDDYRRIARAFTPFGVDKVRFTGGEPLLRRELPEIVAAFREGNPGCDLALTTNGLLLSERLEALVEAGLRRATVHIDSLRSDRYRALMGPGDVRSVLEGALAARERLAEVKLNVVVQRDRNDDEIEEFLSFSRETGMDVRFIELMSTGSANAYTHRALITGREIVERARGTALPRLRPSDPAARFVTPDGVVFGVIASDSEPFCGACVRVRLTADGRLRGCLYEAPGVSLRDVPADALAERIAGALRAKRSHHPHGGQAREAFSMAETGG